MSSQNKLDTDDTNKNMKEKEDSDSVIEHININGDIETEVPEGLSRDNSGDSLDDTCDDSEGALIDRTENTPASLAYGGARPKTTRPTTDRSRVKNGDLVRTKQSEGSEIKVKACDPELISGTQRTGLSSFNDISSLPKLESRPTQTDKSVRLNIPDISREEVVDADLTEDDCYIYTYKGGTAYLSADLPNSFFRLDSGSDGESLPGVAGAGQSNLSTGVAALIQDQLINSPQVRSFSPDQDFIEMDFDPGSESDGDSSSDSGQGRDGTDMEGEDREDDRDGTLSSQEDGNREILSSPEVQHNIILEPVVAPNNNNILTNKKRGKLSKL